MKLNNIFLVIFLFCYSFLYANDLLFNTKSGNVIEGIAYFKDYWIMSQTHNDKSITFSIFNNKLHLKQSINIKYPSHAQDLSIIEKNGKTYIFTTGKNWNGIAVFEFKHINNNFKIIYKKTLKLSIGKNTPTISYNGKYIATIANNSVYIFNYKSLNDKFPVRYLYSFVLNKIQRQKNQWKQGIYMKDNKIYILTGDNSIKHPKYLLIYDAYGAVLKKIRLNLDVQKAKKEGNKLEVEGLTFKDNDLYTTVMTGYNGHNIKRLYKILSLKE